MALGVRAGGWCPQGREAEDGKIPANYPLQPLPGGGYPERTRQNVMDSDGTLIIQFGVLEGGTRKTLDWCRRLQRPYLLVKACRQTPAQAAVMLAGFLDRHAVRVLNVAGPRASKALDAYAYTRAVLECLFSDPPAA